MADVKLFLAGDVMLGRGVDAIMPSPCRPTLHERYLRDAGEYVALAREAGGHIESPVSLGYVWGDALDELAAARPDARIVNLETSITRSENYDPDKGVHYHVSPENAASLTAAGIDACVLANNHVLDWGRAGLADTLATLDRLKILHAGAGRDLDEAEAPAILRVGAGRLLLFALATYESGVPPTWRAGPERAGISVIADLGPGAVEDVHRMIERWRRPGDLVVVSLHWGENWGFAVSGAERRFAHQLIEEAKVDVVYGHSSHHVKAIEVFGERLILYGSGDFIDDYEGIGGREEYRGDLGLMYLVTVDGASGKLRRLAMAPTRVHDLRVNRAGPADAAWLAATLNREGWAFGTRVELGRDDRLELRWR